MDWIALILSVIGIMLNAKKNILCWIVWIASNICWIVYLIPLGQTAQILLWVIFGSFNMYGWYEWKKGGKQ